jgi:hypothetical protein
MNNIDIKIPVPFFFNLNQKINLELGILKNIEFLRKLNSNWKIKI